MKTQITSLSIYKDITKKEYPKWYGWKIIDKAKNKKYLSSDELMNINILYENLKLVNSLTK